MMIHLVLYESQAITFLGIWLHDCNAVIKAHMEFACMFCVSRCSLYSKVVGFAQCDCSKIRIFVVKGFFSFKNAWH